jgi:hypothetical protein
VAQFGANLTPTAQQLAPIYQNLTILRYAPPFSGRQQLRCYALLYEEFPWRGRRHKGGT